MKYLPILALLILTACEEPKPRTYVGTRAQRVAIVTTENGFRGIHAPEWVEVGDTIPVYGDRYAPRKGHPVQVVRIDTIQVRVYQ